MLITRTVTIARSPDELYTYWRDLEHLPRFMYHLQAVRVSDERYSHWVARAPAGRNVEWDAEITADEPGALIAWRSVGDEDVRNSGTVRFTRAPGDRGTEVRVDLEYDPPGGKVGSMIAKLFGEEPGQQLGDDLRRFKQVMEIGEVVRSTAQPEGIGPTVASQHPSRPETEDAVFESRT